MIKHVSGMFYYDAAMPQFLKRLLEMSVIVIGDKTTDIDLNVIETSNYTAGVLMAEHLYELGHRNIAFLTTTIGKKPVSYHALSTFKSIQNL